MKLRICAACGQEIPRRVRRLFAEAEAWCDQERGRRTQLASYLGTTLQAAERQSLDDKSVT